MLKKGMVARTVALAPFIFCVLLDLGIVSGTRLSPEYVGMTMCGLSPLGRVATLVLSANWTIFVEQSCAHGAAEPTASIIAFELKFSAILLFMILLWLVIPLYSRPIDRDPSRDEKVIDKLRAWAPSLGIAIVSTTVLWTLGMPKPSPEFRTGLHSKLYEDVLLLSLVVSWLLFWGAFSELVLYPTLERLPSVSRWFRSHRKTK